MSGNYSRGGGGGGGGRSEYRRVSGRSYQPKNVSAGPPSQPKKSFKKVANNAQGGQATVSSQNADANSDATNSSVVDVARASVQNGGHLRRPLHEATVAAVTGNAGKPSGGKAQKSNRGVPKAPSSNDVTPSSDSVPLSTPVKAHGNASGSFALQFGSISPGVINRIQVPARTSSAPPNLDEQKREQARLDSSGATPTIPTPVVPKQQLVVKKGVEPVGQSSIIEANSNSIARRDEQVPSTTAATQSLKTSVHYIPAGVTIQRPYLPSQISARFGGPETHIESQDTAANAPMPIPIQLPMGNLAHPHLYFPVIQPRPMQPQGMVHQGQNLNFSSQMVPPQLAPPLGNIGFLGPQFQPQQAEDFSARRTVKITHPDTHEELRLDSGIFGAGADPNMFAHSHPITSFPSGHTINYLYNSYNPNLIFSVPSSVSLTSQINPNSHPTSTQIAVKPPASLLGEKASDPQLRKVSITDKDEVPKLPRPHGEASSVHSERVSETTFESSLHQPNLTSTNKKPSTTVIGSASAENLTTCSLLSASSVPVEDSEAARMEAISGSGANKDEEKNAVKKGISLLQDQIDGQSATFLSLSTMSVENVGADLEAPGIRLPTAVSVAASDRSLAISDTVAENLNSTELFGSELNADTLLEVQNTGHEAIVSNKRQEMVSNDGSKPDDSRLETNSRLNLECSLQPEESSTLASVIVVSESGLLNAECVKLVESSSPIVDNRTGMISTSTEIDILNVETSSLIPVSSADSHVCNTSTSDELSSGCDTIYAEQLSAGTADLFALPDGTLKVEDRGSESNSTNTDLFSQSAFGVKDKSLHAKSITQARGKKSMKEILKNADAQGMASDLYMAYKCPEDEKEMPSGPPPVESIGSSPSVTSNRASALASDGDFVSDENWGHSKIEPDDWEDVADTSPKLDTSDVGNLGLGGVKHHPEEGHEQLIKKYSRDFLLKFSERISDLPEGFEIASDIAEALIASNASNSREYPSEVRTVKRTVSGYRVDRRGSGIMVGDDKWSKLPRPETASVIPEVLIASDASISREYPSSVRTVDRAVSGHRLDRCGSGVLVADDKWSKLPRPLIPGRDVHLDLAFGVNVAGFRPGLGLGGNYSVVTNPYGQAPFQHGGILSGPMLYPGVQGGMQRNRSDSERWQRTNSFQKGLVSSPRTPLQVMHKAERKYEVGKITDEEQAKQRQLKGILNKLTPQNFEKLFDQVKQVNIDNAGTLSGVIAQIFDKALMEPTFCEMYANFCCHLAVELPDFYEDDEKITFKRLLLNKCQEEFERGEREQEEANREEEVGGVKQTEAEREEKRIKVRRRMLGNIRLIGELYKKKMLTERIMHECIQKLLGQYQNPDEENIEALCKLMSTIGEMIDHPKAKEHVDAYFDMMSKLSNNMKLSSRVRFMLKDAIDLRKNKWQQRRKVEGPKKIDDIHRDAAQERQAQSSRLTGGQSVNSSVRRGQPMDFVHNVSTVSHYTNAQMGSFRGLSQQLHGRENQDVRFEERYTIESRGVSLPLRPIGNDSITLGPQGGLARGMSVRGQPLMQNISLADIPNPADARKLAAGPSSHSSSSVKTGYGSRERDDLVRRYIPERFVLPSAYGQSGMQEHNMNNMVRDMRKADHTFDRVQLTSTPGRGQPQSSLQNDFPERADRLRYLSIEAIKEFYSAKDEKEVALCIKDLKAPSFYPSMISIWVTDSFERKDFERDLLAQLLIDLARSQAVMLSPDQLVKGFEFVLEALEDAVNDAPKAAEFLGKILAKLLLEDVIAYAEVWRLIYLGGQERGRLVKVGLAAEIVGTILEILRSERGHPFMAEMIVRSNLRVEHFRPPNSGKSWRLEKFL